MDLSHKRVLTVEPDRETRRTVPIVVVERAVQIQKRTQPCWIVKSLVESQLMLALRDMENSKDIGGLHKCGVGVGASVRGSERKCTSTRKLENLSDSAV